MSKFYNRWGEGIGGKRFGENEVFGKLRGNQPLSELDNNFDQETLYYLSEKVINHLADSLKLDMLWKENFKDQFNDFSFFTAPAYKALEGFLFQIASDLKLPSSGNDNLAGSYYFNEEKIDQHIDKLLEELDSAADKESKLSAHEKRDIKDRIREMRGFLQHYRHTPAHFYGESIDTLEKARRNTMTIYGAIDNTAKILLKANLIKIKEDIH